MDRQQKLRVYDSVVAVLGMLAIIAALLCSCSTQRRAYHQDHLRTTHHNNWIKQDNGGCAWSN
jgi:hypothetical protein